MGRKKHETPLPKAPKEATGPNAYSRFEELGAERLGALEQMLMKGMGFSDIVRVIHNEWELWQEVKANTLVKQLGRYRDKYLVPRWQHMEKKVATRAIGQDAQSAGVRREMVERLNVMDRLEEVSEIQRKRILKMAKRESEMPVVTDALTKLFKDYQQGLGQIAHLQLETGILKRAPKVMTGQFGLSDGDGRAVFEFAIIEQQQQRAALADMSDLLQEAIEGECTTVEPAGRTLPAEPATGTEGPRSPRR